jgi:hypothetical protein
MLHATLRGTTRCRWCGRTLRLDVLSRWMLSCMLALLLPNALLYGDVFYSGHLFVVSIFLIDSGMAIRSYIGAPLLGLEVAPDNAALNQRQSALLAGMVLAAALVIDGFIASKIDADNALERQRAPTSVSRQTN